MKTTITIERLGLKILVHTARGTTREYEAIAQPDGRYHILRYEDDAQEIAMVREDRDDAIRSLDSVVEAMTEFAGSRI